MGEYYKNLKWGGEGILAALNFVLPQNKGVKKYRR